MAHAEKLTLRQGEIGPADAAALREVGLDDRAIVDLTLVVAYFNFVTRVADGLTIPLENETP